MKYQQTNFSLLFILLFLPTSFIFGQERDAPITFEGNLEIPVYNVTPSCAKIIFNSGFKPKPIKSDERLKSAKIFDRKLGSAVRTWKIDKDNLKSDFKAAKVVVSGVHKAAYVYAAPSGWGVPLVWASEQLTTDKLGKHYMSKFKDNDKNLASMVKAAVTYQITDSENKEYSQQETLNVIKNVILENNDLPQEVYENYVERKVGALVIEQLGIIEGDVAEIQERVRRNEVNIEAVEERMNTSMKQGFDDIKKHVASETEKLTNAYNNLIDNQTAIIDQVEEVRTNLSKSDQYLFSLLPPEKQIEAIMKGDLGTENMNNRQEQLASLMNQVAINDMQSFNQDLRAYSASAVTILSGIGLLNDEDAAVIGDFVSKTNAGIDIATNIMVGGPLGYMNAASGVMNMFGSGVGDPEAARFDAIMKKLDEMNARLKQIDEKIDNLSKLTVDMYNEMREGFSLVLEEIIKNRKAIQRNEAYIRNINQRMETRGCNAMIVKNIYKRIADTSYTPKLQDYYRIIKRENTQFNRCSDNLEDLIATYNNNKQNTTNIDASLSFFKFQENFLFGSETEPENSTSNYIVNSLYNPVTEYLNNNKSSILAPSKWEIMDLSAATFQDESEIYSGYDWDLEGKSDLFYAMLKPNRLLDSSTLMALSKFIDSRLINAYIFKSLDAFQEDSFDSNRILNSFIENSSDVKIQISDALNLLKGYREILEICIAQNNLITGVQLMGYMKSKLVNENNESEITEIYNLIKKNPIIRQNLALKLLNNIELTNSMEFTKNYATFLEDPIRTNQGFNTVNKLLHSNLEASNWGFNFVFDTQNPNKCVGLNLRIGKNNALEIGLPTLFSIKNGHFIHRQETMELLGVHDRISQLMDELAMTLVVSKELDSEEESISELKNGLINALYLPHQSSN